MHRIAIFVAEHKIPKGLVANFDETGLELVPTNRRTFHRKGDCQIEIIGFGDKRQISAGLGATFLGEKFNPQLIFQGKTHRCHPKHIPSNMAYDHSPSHWQTPETTLRLLEQVIQPFFEKKKKDLKLPTTQWSLLLWDVFYTHIHPLVLDWCDKHWIKMVIIPPNFTSQLQVMDLVVNASFKTVYRQSFRAYCSEVINKQVEEGHTPAKSQLQLGKSALNSEIPQWVKAAWDSISPETIQRGFEKIGIDKCWELEFQALALQEKERYAPQSVSEVAPDEDYYEIVELATEVPEEPLKKRKNTSNEKPTKKKQKTAEASTSMIDKFQGWKELAEEKNREKASFFQKCEALIGKKVVIMYGNSPEEGVVRAFDKRFEEFTVFFESDGQTETDIKFTEMVELK